MKINAKRLLIINLILYALILVAIVFLFTSFNHYLNSPASSKEKVKYMSIERGEKVKDIIRRLHEEKIIKKPDWFYYYVILSGISKRIKAGMHRFSTHLTPKEVGMELISSKPPVIKVTIPEGYTIEQIAEVLDSSHVIRKEEFLETCNNKKFVHSLVKETSLEGFLFPDTYIFYRGEKAEQIIRTMVNRFNEVYSRLSPSKNDRYKILKIASIVEKETAKNEEKAEVSAVIYNRLKKGIKLCMDSTVIYGLSNFDGNLKKEDLKKPTPYNTYLFYGLPPTPICNPGRNSLIAALHPANVDYLYFVSKGDGTHIFSKNLKEHKIWVNKYQKKT
ncbi:MAG: endolytic transglycosylase MltG [Deltaproteobacteria bacterium]|nr:endolytic transglycosylase MltG [Deltaproteobacteria bacterium]